MTFCFLPPRPEQEREREIYYPVLNFFCRFGAGAASQSELSGGPWGSGRVAPPIWRSADKAAAAAAEHCVFPFEIPRDGLPPPRPHPPPPKTDISTYRSLLLSVSLSLSLFFVGIIAFFVHAAHRFPQTQVSAVFFGCWGRSRVGGGGGRWRLRFCAVRPPNLAVLPLLGICAGGPIRRRVMTRWVPPPFNPQPFNYLIGSAAAFN